MSDDNSGAASGSLANGSGASPSGTSTLDPINQQRLDELAGVRGQRVAPRAAVRKSDMAAIVSIAPTTATTLASGATVTSDDYNALLNDFQALSAAIAQIAAQVKT